MTFRKRLRLLITTLFDPRKAVAEGLYDGRVIKSKWILAYRFVSMMFIFALYKPFATIVIPTIVEYGAVVLILTLFGITILLWFEYSLMPRLFLCSFTLRSSKRLTKRERREQRRGSCVTLETYRQIVLFSQLAMSIAFLPVTIINIVYPQTVNLSYIGSVFPMIWIFIAIFPAFAVSRGKTIAKILFCHVVNFLAAALAFSLVVFFLMALGL